MAHSKTKNNFIHIQNPLNLDDVDFIEKKNNKKDIFIFL